MSETASSEITRLRDLSPQQKKSGLAAWLGWTFDGLDMHIYTLVALPFVASLMHLPVQDPTVPQHGAIIQASFLVGWAFGGAIFGRIGDLIGRSRALCLTILTYALFTGLSSFSQTWWHLMIFRFLSALGIGGEWAVGASLLSETWPKHWRPWIAATLQSGVNIGVLVACGAGYLFRDPEVQRWIFLVGILPALLTLWIRKAVPETEEWKEARGKNKERPPGIAELFRGEVLPVTLKVTLICAVGLTAHWAFMYWHQAHVRNHPEVKSLGSAAINNAATVALFLVMAGSIIGNYLSAWLAKCWGYRRAIVTTLAVYFVFMVATYSVSHSHATLRYLLFAIGMCQGVFGLFTMCLPPLFPTLLRTTGAGFCFNIGRIAAAAGTIYFGIFVKVGDYRTALLYASYLFIPAALLGFLLPNDPEDSVAPQG